jgi:large subunit ribosomal protein L11
MGKKEIVEILIEGGKATAAPPLGPALGPMGVNIGKVVADINNKTSDFKGMKVPVKVIIDKDTKDYTIKVGTPPATQLIKKEAGVQKGAKNPRTETVGNISFEQLIKITRMKEDSLLGKNMSSMAKEILGTCRSMGITVDNTHPQKIIEAINKGEFKDKLN